MTVTSHPHFSFLLRLTVRFACATVLLLTSQLLQGQTDQDVTAPPFGQIIKEGEKTRIVFDYHNAPPAAPEATPAPAKRTGSRWKPHVGLLEDEPVRASVDAGTTERKPPATNDSDAPQAMAAPTPSRPAGSAVTNASAGAGDGLPVNDPTQIDVIEAVNNTRIAADPPIDEPIATDRQRTPSESVTINLINKLVDRGILTKEDAAGMIQQAEVEAETVRQQNQADMVAIARLAASQAASDQIAIAQAEAAPGENDVRVTYIPEPVKTQIKEDIKMELVKEAHEGSFALGPTPVLPFWVSRVHPFIDFRFRYEGDFFPETNDATGAFPNFNAINTGPPFDVTGNEFAPQFNVDQDRNRFRIRVRFGAGFDLTEHLTTGLRVATGDSNSPVTTNQTIGLANQGQGGDFSKYAIWLDRAFVRYEVGREPNKNLALLLGRFDNPFFYTNLTWDDDLGFDGIALQARYEVTDGVVPFLTAGAFPVYNTDFNFSSNQPTKFQSYDKYLFGGQFGIDWRPTPDWSVTVAAAYYYFYNVEGKLSSPYTPLNEDDASDTDNSRPSFAQKGNTYFPIRNIVPDASNDFGAINQWQYYGLATPFQELALTARADYNGFEPVQISLIGEFVQNLAFNKDDINAIAVNNRGAVDPNDIDNVFGAFEGSPMGWLVEMRIGTPALVKLWDWSVVFGYRWIGSDSVVDGFNDSDFGLGGTNMRGFTVGGALALSPNLWFGLRWMGSDSIAGPTFKVDVIQFDLHAKF